MKTVSENVNRNVPSDKVPNKKGTRKFLQTLQPSGGDKENLVGTGRISNKNAENKPKFQAKTEVELKTNEKKSIIAKVNPSLYKKLITDDLTSIAGPSEKYWEVIAERRRKALEEALEQNRKLHAVVIALEEENASCKELLDQTTDLVNTLKEVLNEKSEDQLSDESTENDDADLPTDQSNSNDDSSDNESE